MNISRIARWLAASLFAAGSSHAATVDTLTDHGPDGEGHYYSVTCSDGTPGNIVAYPTSSRVCVQLVGSAEVCRDAWTAESAAAYGCLSLAGGDR